MKVGGTDQPHSEPKAVWNQTKQKYLTVIIATHIYQSTHLILNKIQVVIKLSFNVQLRLLHNIIKGILRY